LGGGDQIHKSRGHHKGKVNEKGPKGHEFK
jgi:hypothetical protein